MKHPYQQLLSNKSGTLLFTAVQNHIQIYSLSEQTRLISSWHDELKSQHVNAQIQKRTGRATTSARIHNYIKSLALSSDEQYLVATADSDKSVLIFDISNGGHLQLIKRQPLPKRPSAVTIWRDVVLVADKFGDVYRVKLDSDAPVSEDKLELVLGHVSMLNCLVVAQSGQGKTFLITGDRDEHIRVTNYPKSYVIRGFLFGHQEFVSSLKLLSGADSHESPGSVLVSGGGDTAVFFWDWYEGKLLDSIDLVDYLGGYLNDFHLSSASDLVAKREMLKSETTETNEKEDEKQNQTNDDNDNNDNDNDYDNDNDNGNDDDVEEEEKQKYEISVSKIDTLTIDNQQYIVVLVENTACLIILQFDLEEKKAWLAQIVKLSHAAVTFAVANDKLVVSLDAQNNDILQMYKFDAGQFVVDDDDEEGKNGVKCIVESDPVDLDEREWGSNLFTLASLRKRGEH
ncbi:uncharacterized protein LODBEIA_P60090 [Lodderomyces beijingensis]|uniref:Transfer RNA methyltransferase 82 n=1 Tax=Lodderomyces beijingensis TaxID=1775926 RepID=A0ABP0ZUG5_9ASCO